MKHVCQQWIPDTKLASWFYFISPWNHCLFRKYGISGCIEWKQCTLWPLHCPKLSWRTINFLWRNKNYVLQKWKQSPKSGLISQKKIHWKAGAETFFLATLQSQLWSITRMFRRIYIIYFNVREQPDVISNSCLREEKTMNGICPPFGVI